ncbi:MAG TPA: baseplate assembly protein [Methylothermaceae bacterium]|nr:baseplate assembly protein [Methylothermaceae bacterium]
MTSYFGKYRGTVVENTDPKKLGRVKVCVPEVLDEVTVWAMPCMPFAGKGVGLFTLPPVGAGVWVEFEAGNLDRPIWSGCFWREGEVPAEPAGEPLKVIQTGQVTVTIDDRSGSAGIVIETRSGARIAITPDGIEIANGKGAVIELAQNKVSINGNALEVT